MRISIVTPSFNQRAFVEVTLKSVLDQGVPALEYIVMDGGSSDGSREIIEGYGARLAHWESAPDKGQADAVYRGFEWSTGEILGWVNSDDVLLPGALARVARFFDENPEENWVVGSCLMVDARGAPLRTRLGSPVFYKGYSVSFSQLLYWGPGFAQPASFWRRRAFFECGGFDRSLQFCFDYDLYLRLAARRASGAIPECLACFRVHGGSKSARLADVRRSEEEILWARHHERVTVRLPRRLTRRYFEAAARARNLKWYADYRMGRIRLPGGAEDPEA